MIRDDMDEILLSEKIIEPSPALARNVMACVRSEASNYARIPFPWIRFWAITAVLIILAVWFFPAGSVLRAVNSISYSIGSWVLAPGNLALRRALLSALASVLGSLVLVWFSFGLTGAGDY